MKKVLFLLPLAFSLNAADSANYDEKRRLFCELTSMTPLLSDLQKGDIRDGGFESKTICITPLKLAAGL
ncbi:hypothetical protein [Vibrio diabolicus]|uniref:hypothetical protein n=1 Tax=Vibrio diabolicus TaxID=50719 RepID=UPI002495320D|nr:hypothetical protein [Vibrio diabolicus]